MHESALALILEECIEAMERGGEPAEIAAHYPALESELLPLLLAARELRAPQDPPLRAEFLNQLGEQLRAAP